MPANSFDRALIVRILNSLGASQTQFPEVCSAIAYNWRIGFVRIPPRTFTAPPLVVPTILLSSPWVAISTYILHPGMPLEFIEIEIHYGLKVVVVVFTHETPADTNHQALNSIFEATHTPSWTHAEC